MFHPAAALHQAALKPAILADFAKLPQLLEVARREIAKTDSQPVRPEPAGASPAQILPAPEPQVAKTEEPKQMKLF